MVDSGGFGYLDAPGHPKPVFDSVYRLPGFTLLPNAPEEIIADWQANKMTARFSCETGKRVEVLLPIEGCKCVATPSGALDGPSPVVGMAVADCLSGVLVELSCTCPEPLAP